MTDSSNRRGWTRVAFGDVVRLSRERSSSPVEDGFEHYVGLEHLDPGDLKVRRWGSSADGTTFTNVFRSGQVLFGKRRAYQHKLAVADFCGVCSGDIYVIEPKDERLLPELLPFICQTDRFFDHAVGTSAGSLSPRTNWQSLAKYKFELPPLEEQRRIADALARTRELTDSVVRLREGCSRVFAAAAAQEFETLLNEATPMVELASVCLQKPQSGLYKSEESRGRGAHMVNMGELFGNDIIDDTVGMGRIAVDEKELQRYALTPDDLLFGRRSIVLEGAGRCVLVRALSEPAVFESSVLRVTIDAEQADSSYVFEWVRSPHGQKHMKRIVTFTTVSGIAGSDLSRVPVPLPSLARQKEVAARLGGLRLQAKVPKERLAACCQLASLIVENMLGGAR
ncbi:MAG: restriction endonuclease subunit S [Thermoleophilia bacterium]|nr:restriction endonuclease subunit S [Thermoleophilia bacterium]